MAALPDKPAPVRPPRDYTAPAPTGSVVTSYAELAAEVAMAGPRVIVVADGTYVGAALTTAQGHHIWAQNRGRVTFEFGLGFRGNAGVAGGSVHGIVFEVDDPADCDTTAAGVNEAIVNTWDTVDPVTVGTGLVVEDCEFDGAGVIGSAVQAVNPSGLTVRRCVIRRFLDYGIYALRSASAPDALDTIVLEDVDIDDVSRLSPGSAGGTAELGIFIGHTFEARRIKIRNCAWSGFGIVHDASGWVLEDFDIDSIGWGYFEAGSVGVYCEESHNGDIRRGLIGTRMKVGINCEWNQGNANPYLNTLVPRNHDIRIEESTIRAYKVGVGFDLSVANCSVRRCRIERAWLAAVLDNNTFPDDAGDFQVPDGDDPIVTTNTVDLESCSFLLPDGVPAVLHDHHGTPSLLPTVPGWPLTPDGVDPSKLTLTAYGHMGALVSLLRSRTPTVLRDVLQTRAATQWLAEQASEALEAVGSAHAPLSSSVGQQLDKHGAGLLRPRAGLDDDAYRTELQVKFAALFRARSPELAEALLDLLTAGTSTTGSFTEWPPAAYEYTLEDIAAATAVRWEALLRTAKPEGVRMQTRVIEDSANAFRFDSGPGYDEGLYAYTLES